MVSTRFLRFFTNSWQGVLLLGVVSSFLGSLLFATISGAQIDLTKPVEFLKVRFTASIWVFFLYTLLFLLALGLQHFKYRVRLTDLTNKHSESEAAVRTKTMLEHETEISRLKGTLSQQQTQISIYGNRLHRIAAIIVENGSMSSLDIVRRVTSVEGNDLIGAQVDEAIATLVRLGAAEKQSYGSIHLVYNWKSILQNNGY